MALTDTQARAELAFRIAGVSTIAGATPILRRRRVGAAYKADCAHEGAISDVGHAVTVRFQLPGDLDADFIELEIPAVAGVYRIECVRVEGVEVADLARRVIAVHDCLFETFDASPLRFGADARRPCLEIDVRGIDGGDAGVVEVVIVREDSAFELRRLVLHNAQEFTQQLRRQTGELGETAFAHGEELRWQASRLDGHGERLQSLLDAQGAQADALRELRQALAHVDDHVRSASDGLQAQGEAVLAQLSRQASALDAAREQELHSQRQIEALQAQVRQLQWSFENVFWRRWLRRLRTGRA